MGLEVGTLVEIRGVGEGVVAWDPFGDLHPEQSLVATGRGLHSDLVTSHQGDLKPTGTYQPEIVDASDCGAGTSNPCAFLGIGPQGQECLRFTQAGHMLMSRSVGRPQLAPVSLFPVCQDEIHAAAKGQPNRKMLKANEVTHRTLRARAVGSFSVNGVEYTLLERTKSVKEKTIKAVATVAALAAVGLAVVEALKEGNAE